MNSEFSYEEIMKELRVKARPNDLEGMRKFGMKGDTRLGVAIPELRKMAKEIGRDHTLALKLWETGIPDAMTLASMVDNPEEVTEEQVDAWVQDIASWDVCDQTCMNLFEKLPFVLPKIHEWSKRDEEFVKRTAYALIACLAWHDKKASDEFFIKLFPIIKSGVNDERNFVKKAVNWALRNIGKRNLVLNREAIKLAKEIQKIDSKSARWIAVDAIRELESQKIQAKLKR